MLKSRAFGADCSMNCCGGRNGVRNEMWSEEVTVGLMPQAHSPSVAVLPHSFPTSPRRQDTRPHKHGAHGKNLGTISGSSVRECCLRCRHTLTLQQGFALWTISILICWSGGKLLTVKWHSIPCTRPGRSGVSRGLPGAHACVCRVRVLCWNYSTLSLKPQSNSTH